MHNDFDIAALDSHPAFRRTPSRNRKRAVRHPSACHHVWPLPAIDGVSPTIAEPGACSVLVTYAGTVQPPCFIPVFAVGDGAILYAGAATDTHAIVIDHGDEHRSFYWGLSHAFVLTTNQQSQTLHVKAGDVLGYVCRSSPHGAVLHFGMMKRQSSGHFRSLDPSIAMQSWSVLPLEDDRTTPPTIQPIAA